MTPIGWVFLGIIAFAFFGVLYLMEGMTSVAIVIIYYCWMWNLTSIERAIQASVDRQPIELLGK